MYFWSLLHGHATSRWPTASGAPTECTHGTNTPSLPSTSKTARPMRVMIRMLTTTYGLSDSSMPMCAIGLPSGPIENGTTYSVRPRMHPAKSPFSVRRMSAGATQLLVGPASSWLALQMNVRSSTRATSDGSEQRQVAAGPQGRVEVRQRAGGDHFRAQAVVFGLAAVAPDDASGCVSAAISRTQPMRRACCT